MEVAEEIGISQAQVSRLEKAPSTCASTWLHPRKEESVWLGISARFAFALAILCMGTLIGFNDTCHSEQSYLIKPSREPNPPQ